MDPVLNVTKDPDAVLDYSVDWTEWLPGDDAISDSIWEVPDDLTASRESVADARATVFLAGGESGQTYHVTNRITTEAGRVDDRTIRVRVTHR